MVIIDAMTAGENNWDTTSIKVKSSDTESAVVTVEYTDLYDGQKMAEFSVVIEDGTLKIDNVTYNLERE